MLEPQEGLWMLLLLLLLFLLLLVAEVEVCFILRDGCVDPDKKKLSMLTTKIKLAPRNWTLLISRK